MFHRKWLVIEIRQLWSAEHDGLNRREGLSFDGRIKKASFSGLGTINTPTDDLTIVPLSLFLYYLPVDPPELTILGSYSKVGEIDEPSKEMRLLWTQQSFSCGRANRK